MPRKILDAFSDGVKSLLHKCLGVAASAVGLFHRKFLDVAEKGLDSLRHGTKPQLAYCLLAVGVLFVVLLVLGPQQVPVVLYKLLLAPLGGLLCCGVWLSLVPYANPSRYLETDWRKDPDADIDGDADFKVVPGYEAVFSVCLICAALAFVVGMVAVGMGL